MRLSLCVRIDSRNLLGLNILLFTGVLGVADRESSERFRVVVEEVEAFGAYGPRCASSHDRHRLLVSTKCRGPLSLPFHIVRTEVICTANFVSLSSFFQ
jgi:hypothetical protein